MTGRNNKPSKIFGDEIKPNTSYEAKRCVGSGVYTVRELPKVVLERDPNAPYDVKIDCKLVRLMRTTRSTRHKEETICESVDRLLRVGLKYQYQEV